MAIKDKVNDAWQEIDTLKVPVNGAYQEADHANALVDGAWQEVWSSGIPCTVTCSFSSVNITANTITPHGNYVDFNLGGNASTYAANVKLWLASDIDIPANTPISVSFDIDITSKQGAGGVYLRCYWDATNSDKYNQTLLSIPESSQTVSFSTLTPTKDVFSISIHFDMNSTTVKFAGTISNLVINGEKCKFV